MIRDYSTPEQKATDLKEIRSSALISHIFRTETGYPLKLERIGCCFGGGIWRQHYQVCPPKLWETHPEKCLPKPGYGIIRRCPNENRLCQFFFNYSKFLDCYNKLEHMGGEKARGYCDIFIRSIPPQLLEIWDDMRTEEGDSWPGIKSNYAPKKEEEDDD